MIANEVPKKVLGRFGALVLLMALAAVPLAAAQEEGAVYRASGETFTGPEQLPTGFVDVTLHNEGEHGYTLVLLRLKEGAAAQAAVSAVEAVDKAFAEGGNAASAFNKVLALADVVGNSYAEPGASYSFGAVLEAGSYVAYGTADPAEEGALPVGTHRLLEVAGEARADAPQADVTVQMVDFAFALPADIAAGEQTWEVVNVGEQIHHMILFKLHEGKTVDDVMAWMESEEGPPPADEAGATGVMSSGQSNYATFDLTPGDYIALCFMPDHLGEATGQPHVALGMMQSFSVAGE